MDYYIHLIHLKTKNLKHLFNSKNRFFMRKSIFLFMTFFLCIVGYA